MRFIPADSRVYVFFFEILGGFEGLNKCVIALSLWCRILLIVIFTQAHGTPSYTKALSRGLFAVRRLRLTIARPSDKGGASENL